MRFFAYFRPYIHVILPTVLILLTAAFALGQSTGSGEETSANPVLSRIERARALAAVHQLQTEVLDFRGVVRLAAAASQTQTGIRSWLLKPFDPLLRRDGAGTRLVVTVKGTRDAPKFGLDMGATLNGER